jgi:acyl-CoA dehydrogenase
LTEACAAMLTKPSAARDRLTVGMFKPTHGEGLALLDRAFDLVVAVQPIRDRMRSAHAYDVAKALSQRTITAEEAERLKSAAEAVSAVVAVDDFAPEELTHQHGTNKDDRGEPPSPATSLPPANAAE